MLKLANGSSPQLVDEIFGNGFLNSFENFPLFEKPKTLPKVNIYESEKEYRIEVAAPGLDKKDFTIDVKEDVLTLSSNKENVSEEEKDNVLRREFNHSSFERSFVLPEDIKTEKISAKHLNGILNITIPKKDKPKEKLPRTINID